MTLGNHKDCPYIGLIPVGAGLSKPVGRGNLAPTIRDLSANGGHISHKCQHALAITHNYRGAKMRYQQIIGTGAIILFNGSDRISNVRLR